ncbi:AraC family transcriptional regulator [Anaerosporobacter sp.]|uniref:AraC family transcriptional regulator n=1 Tax=Anaerosporobacter sp. TaxID=1872529 RepID=UPI00286F706E|nr:AraC family transcriptional regulator [Anaerosporobacter sp.]
MSHSTALRNEAKRIIASTSGFARSNYIFLQEVGQITSQPDFISQRNSLLSYLFLVVEEGEGEFTYEEEKYDLKAGDCIFINCEHAYSHCAKNGSWTIHWLHFFGNNMNLIYDEYLQLEGKVVFAPKCPDKYIYLMEEIYRLSSNEIPIKEMLLYNKFTSLLCEIWKDNHSSSEEMMDEGKNQQILKQVKSYISKNFAMKVTLEELASKFFIDKFYLTRLFKKEYGKTIFNYLLECRLLESKRLLRNTKLSIAEIAIQVGINDVSYFTKVFKKIEGLSPRDYRKKWQEV